MIDKSDYEEIAAVMKVVIENTVTPLFDFIVEELQTIHEKIDNLVPKNRVEKIEDEVKLLKLSIKLQSEVIAKL